MLIDTRHLQAYDPGMARPRTLGTARNKRYTAVDIFLGMARRHVATLAVLAVLGTGSWGWAKAPSPSGAPPALNAQDVGIDEKLGQFVPLDSVLNDEDGHRVTLRSLVDRPTILTLNYFRCASICSPQLNGVADTINRTNAVVGQQFRVITVSFDERDTPDIAVRKRTNYLQEIQRPIAPADWRFLTGDAATTKKIADAVGFKFKRVGDDFVHPGALMFLSPKGQVTRYMYGITYVPADWEMAVREAARGEVQPTINKWLSFCYSYDPSGRRVVLNVTRLAGTFILGTAIAFAVVLIVQGKRSKSRTKRDA
jgi:protein SCO1